MKETSDGLTTPQTAKQINSPQVGNVEVSNDGAWLRKTLDEANRRITALQHGKEVADKLRELSEMSEVLKWASENVFQCRRHYLCPSEWVASDRREVGYYQSPTLYEALKKAWENREGK